MYILYIVFAIAAIFGGGAYAVLAPTAQPEIIVQRSHAAGESAAAVARALRRAYLDDASYFPAVGPGGAPVLIPASTVAGFGTLSGGFTVQPDVDFWLDGQGNIFPLDRSTTRRDPALSEAAFVRTGPLTAPKTLDRNPPAEPEDDGITTIQGPSQ